MTENLDAGRALDLVCCTCFGELIIDDTCRCDTCGARFEIVHETVQFMDWRALEREPLDLLAGWHLTQVSSLDLYRDGSPDSYSAPERDDVQAVRRFLQASGLDMLDIGSGSFRVPGYVPDDVGTYVGIDPIPPEGVPPFPLVSAFAERLPFNSNRFDVVLFATSLDHVFHVPSALREARRVLRPGGSIVFWGGLVDDDDAYRELVTGTALGRTKSEHGEPMNEARQRLDEVLADIESNADQHQHLLLDPNHVRHFSLAALVDVFAKEGLAPVRFDHIVVGHAVSSSVVEFVAADDSHLSTEVRPEAMREAIAVARRVEDLHHANAFANGQLQDYVVTQVEHLSNSMTAQTSAVRDELTMRFDQLQAQNNELRTELSELSRRQEEQALAAVSAHAALNAEISRNQSGLVVRVRDFIRQLRKNAQRDH